MYSQNNEEQIILELLGDTPGFFVDIGAYDGKAFSNTLALVERGWRGILVEPSPGPFSRLRDLHGDNERLKLVNAAIGEKPGTVLMWPSEDGVSTTDHKHYEKWRATVPYGEQIEVKQVTFSDIMLGQNTLDFLNIDVEGKSAELLLSFPFAQWQPQVICVEHDGRQDELLNLLSGMSYHPELENGENMIFAKKVGA